ncbi:MAG: type III secretion system chaperone [Pseudomonadota bacterium]
MNPVFRNGSGYLHRLAADLGVADYQAGSLWFSLDGGIEVVVEPLEDGSAIAAHANLGPAPVARDEAEDDPCYDLLVANVPDANADGDAVVYAIDPVSESLMLFTRLPPAEPGGYEDFAARVRAFAQAAQTANDALPGMPPRASAARRDPRGRLHDDTFANLWAEYAFKAGLARGVPEAQDGGYLLALHRGGFVLVQPESGFGRVLLKAVLAFIPLDDDIDEAVVCRQLLEAHLLGEATGGAYFAIDRKSHELIACRRLALNGLDAHALDEAIDALANTAQHFCNRLKLLPVLAEA